MVALGLVTTEHLEGKVAYVDLQFSFWVKSFLLVSLPEHITEDCVQMAFESLQRMRSHSLSVQYVQCSVSLLEKKFFLMFRMNLLGISFCTLPLVLLLGTMEHSPVHALIPSCRYLCTSTRFPLSFSFSRSQKGRKPKKLKWKNQMKGYLCTVVPFNPTIVGDLT